MKLLETHTLPIKRYEENSGYIEEGGTYVKGTLLPIFNIKCSVQPHRNGNLQQELPDGVRSQDVIVVYSRTELLTSDEFINQEADETTYRGRDFECFYVEPWVGYGLVPDHFRSVFIRKDKL